VETESRRVVLHPTTPWLLRPFNLVPVAPIWVGTGIGLVLFAISLVYTSLFGEGVGRLGEVRFANDGWVWAAELIQDLFTGFTLTVSAASIGGARRDLDELLPHLGVDGAERASIERQVFSYRRVPLALVGFVVAVAVGVSTVLDPGLWKDGVLPHWTHPAAIWMFGRNALNWWVASRAMLLELMLGHEFSRLGDRLAPTDLLDRSQLAPFGRRALRNVMLWMLLAAFLSLNYLREGWASSLLAVALAGLALFALAAFLLPLLGARRRIAEIKQAELLRVRGVIRTTRTALFERPESQAAPGGRLADLLAWESRVEAVSEWPIDASVLLRLGFYLTVGLGSWVGAAMVERILDVALR